MVFGFMAIIQAVGFMFGQGSGSLIARELGRKDVKEASTTASIGFFCAMGAGAVITVVCFPYLDPLIMLLGSTETIAPYAKAYITFILIAVPFMTSSFVLNNILRYEGKAALGMIGLIIGAVLNMASDPLFMFVFRMGIAGAGLSTALSQVVSFCILLGMFLRGKTSTRQSLRAVSLKAALLFLPLCMVTEMLYQCTGHRLGAALLSSIRSGIIFSLRCCFWRGSGILPAFRRSSLWPMCWRFFQRCGWCCGFSESCQGRSTI